MSEKKERERPRWLDILQTVVITLFTAAASAILAALWQAHDVLINLTNRFDAMQRDDVKIAAREQADHDEVMKKISDHEAALHPKAMELHAQEMERIDTLRRDVEKLSDEVSRHEQDDRQRFKARDSN